MRTLTDVPPRGARQPWRAGVAGLVLLGTAGAMMAYGAPAHASTTARAAAVTRPAATVFSPAAAPASDRSGTLVAATLLQPLPAGAPTDF